MNPALYEYRFLGALVPAVIIPALITPSPAGPAAVLLLAIFAVVFVFTRSWPDRGLYLACAGEPLAIACSMVHFWAGLVVICLLAALIAEAFGIARTREDYQIFAAFFGVSLVVAIIIHLANHVLVPLVIIMGAVLIIVAIQSVRTYQLRKQYAGA